MIMATLVNNYKWQSSDQIFNLFIKNEHFDCVVFLIEKEKIIKENLKRVANLAYVLQHHTK